MGETKGTTERCLAINHMEAVTSLDEDRSGEIVRNSWILKAKLLGYGL